ncbi:hypothetical protein Vau01_124280 [Virgisporangium aurantiacum]|uniref:Uncharacterized protein n=1 Tax=Virgisporangium aurantiacum TaxID=175570 RepID=A0A8J3ZL21_9ACTN|nr:hypothetical protein Vau01_124280 [Virgisporangium aurantiacum]
MPVSFAANVVGNSDSRCIMVRIPSDALDVNVTAVSRASTGADGSTASSIGADVSGMVGSSLSVKWGSPGGPRWATYLTPGVRRG